jgi:formylmethanofuran dehydrogenase subunit E
MKKLTLKLAQESSYACDKGWYNLIDDCLNDIQKYLDISVPEFRKDFKVEHIKEKFGSLRIYFSVSDGQVYDIINDIIRYYEIQSTMTCEVCGENGKMRSCNMWLKTLCDKCYKEWINE